MPATTADTQAFAAFVRRLDMSDTPELRGFFAADLPVSLARAPGRLDVMGGIADYSGSLVLQLPIREATFVAAQLTDADEWQIVSLSTDGADQPRRVMLSQQDRAAWNSYESAREWFRQDPSTAWAAYIAGVLFVLREELDAKVEVGVRLLVRSDVPEGKGVSSSAALEVAVLRAVTHQLGIDIDGIQAAHLCQLAENLVVGAPCGIMDQMTSALGRADELLALLCQPADVQGFVPLPKSLGFWGIDSGIRHAVTGSSYAAVRTGAFMGYRMIASLAGLTAHTKQTGTAVSIDDSRWNGYLANLTPTEFATAYADRLPERMTGAEFLAQFDGTSDTVTRVQPEESYTVRQPTAHPVYENARVRRFRDLLSQPLEESALIEMGELMYASHESYSACGIGSPGTDRLVEMVRSAGPAAGLYGAKITGGGSGGTVAVLGSRSAGDAVRRIAREYAAESGQGGYLFCGSSAGAWSDEVRSVSAGGPTEPQEQETEARQGEKEPS